jgi:phenylpropionate dioxygenase-like ring-hydroxylating dioxygenase large terminal subunit
MDVIRPQKIRRVDPSAAPKGGTPIEHVGFPDLGTDIIPKERYTSAEFMAREWDKLWTKVWLLGGMERDIPEAGDYICTEIGTESVIIIRQADGGVKAFYNVCPHRGNQLTKAGVGQARDGFTCSYHGWQYALDGEIKDIPDLETFRQGKPCDSLTELPCDVWGSFVWFSLNPNAEPLRDFLDVIPSHIDPYHFERMTLTRDVTMEWECNWKASVDAFNETYHVQATHPQLLWYLDDIDVQIDCYDKHSRYLVPFGTISQRVPYPPEIPEPIKTIMKGAEMDPASYEGDRTKIREAVQKYKRKHGTEQGKDYSELNDDQLTDDYNYLIFPNITLNTHADDLMLFRHRPHPTDPNRMYFDVWTFELLPESERDEPRRRPRHRFFRPGEKTLGKVVDQDASNLPRVQRGMNSAAYKGLWLSEQEVRIRHFHKVVSDYIYGPKGKGPKDI